MKQKNLRLALGIVIVAFVLGFLFWLILPKLMESQKPQGPITLIYWGFEDERTIKPIIQNYQTTHPQVKINYVAQNNLNYRTRVQTQIRAGSGPDIFWIHNSWTGMFAPDLYPAPASIMSLNDYSQAFFPVAKDTLTSQDQILAVPNELDGLVMYVNQDILKAAGLSVPALWPDFINTAASVTVRNQVGQIQTSGAALGTTGNIDYWSDILGLLMSQQPKVNLVSPATSQGAEVLKFYTSFVLDPKFKTWDQSLPSSTQMFADGKLAFYFGPASQAVVFKNANPNLNFATYPVPQLPGKVVTWGSFGATAVSNHSAHPKEAWEFVKYLSSEEVEQEIVKGETQYGPLVKPYARVNLSKTLIDDPIFGSFVKQGPYYKSWYLNYNLADAGINDEVTSTYARAVNATLGGQDPQAALNSVSGDLQAVVDKYTKPAPTASP